MLRNQIFIEFFCYFIFLVPAFLTAQTLDISSVWKFQKGDDPTWALLNTDDSAWMEVPVGEGWERFTSEDYDGFGWYRKRVVIPSSLKKAAEFYGGFMLNLGRIDDIDQTFFNGNFLAQQGIMPPNSQTAWDVNRHYFIPISDIKWDVENLIAVRVYDSGGGGGLYVGPYELEPRSWKDFFKIGIDYPFKNAEIVQNESFFININLKNESKEDLKAVLKCQIYSYGEKELLLEKSVDIKIKKGKFGKIPVRFNGLPFGIYKVKTTLTNDKGYKISTEKGLAASPEKIISTPTLPADFDTFWAKAKADLAKVAPNFKVFPQEHWSNDKVVTFLIEMQSLDNVKVRGCITIPKGRKNLPALLRVQGYSSYMTPDTTIDDFVVFSLNIRGHGNSRDDINPGFPGFLFHGFGSPDTYIYRGAYMDCIRAVDYICTRPEVDKTRIAVEGGSQGGALSFATAALDERIKLCLPDVPFLSDFRNYFNLAEWPADEFKAYQAQTNRSWEDIYRVLDYFDIKNFTPKITCPVIMGVGVLDDVCPPQINFAAYNNLATDASQKSYFLYPTAAHSLPWKEHPPLKMKWMRDKFGVK